MFEILSLSGTRRFLVGAATIGMCLTARPATAAGTPIDRTISVSPGTEIDLSNVFGSIEIRGSDGDQVRLGGTLGADSALQESHGTKVLMLSVQPPQGHFSTPPEPTRLVVYVPRASSVVAHTVMADVTARDLAGSLDVTSSVGNIDIEAISNVLRAKSINGTITVSDPSPGSMISLDDVSGAVNVNRLNGALAWNSTSGSISVDDCAPSRVDLRSVSGRIKVRCNVKKTATYRIASRYGGVRFHSVSRLDARFVLTTRYGIIQNQLSPSYSHSEGPTDRVSRFTVGSGEALVTVETESGGIVVD